MDPKGIQMCRIVQVLGGICLVIGVVVMFLASEFAARMSGLGMIFLGGWGGYVYYVVPKNPLGLRGWRRAVVTPWVEDAIRRDFLAPGPKDSTSVLHAAKRFTIFCFFFCLILGYAGAGSIIPAATIGGGAAFIFEWIIRRSEAKKSQVKPNDKAR